MYRMSKLSDYFATIANQKNSERESPIPFNTNFHAGKLQLPVKKQTLQVPTPTNPQCR